MAARPGVQPAFRAFFDTFAGMSQGGTVTHQGKTFTNVDYAGRVLADREFIGCTFVSCNFHQSDLSGNDFVDCRFEGCNFSMAVLRQTGLSKAVFVHCKMLGVDFTVCNSLMFSVSMAHCVLNYATFLGMKLKKMRFESCTLQQTDFSDADLSMAAFHDCDLSDTVFHNTLLEKADFSTARHYRIDPTLNRLRKARFSQRGLAGLLERFGLDIVDD